ncbi:GntR family transcriptional regulator [Aeromicrobium endophyticum]|uniref:GntR family transcriptional regulator n=1 Tax=Aeromicrobium endophyticum TaxID=2292704 RepID=A0A371PAV6_9ACTN|nr:GntR family transcriptional regulator [Aeromicrobium endophyticum]REK73085.1 GntR family transcriptional regulator [Aeromicrobium endophyticum]
MASSDLAAGSGALSDRLVDELQRRILNGEVAVGSWLRHGAIAEEFGISRTPVREALRVLQAQGIVTIVQNRGARVNGHSGRDIRELGEVRAELEGLAAELAAERISDEQLERMHTAWKGFAETIAELSTSRREPSEEANRVWAEANEAFHGVILEASGNRQLLLSINDVSRRLPRNSSFPAYAKSSRLLQQNVDEHLAVADAIVARDGPGARAAMAQHIRSSSESMARWAEDNARLRED